MRERARRLMSATEFLAWDNGTDTRYELIDGVPVAIKPPSRDHACITNSVGVLADRALVGRSPCRAVQHGAVRLPDRAGGNVYVPDVLVTCEPLDDGTLFNAPRLITEVLTPLDRDFAEHFKVPLYGCLGSVEEIWLVHSEIRCVEVWRRVGDAWRGSLPLIGRAT